ncbi:hypothetical protein EIJ82_01760 [Alkalihalobacillus clausii]|nr:hypothetical protein [Shouchella clausii]
MFGKRPEGIKRPIVKHGPPNLVAPMTQCDYELTMCSLITYPLCEVHEKLGIDNAIDKMTRDQRFDLFNLKCNPDAKKPESKSLLAIVFSEIQKANSQIQKVKGESDATEAIT